MFFTQTEFRIILGDVTGDPKNHILNGHFLDRTTKVNKKRQKNVSWTVTASSRRHQENIYKGVY